MGADVLAARKRLADVAGRRSEADELGGLVSATVRSLVEFDGWCLLGLDPDSWLRTFQFGGHGVEVTVDNARNEWLMTDVNQYADLARQKTPAGWLSDEHPAAATSFRMNEILRPQGVSSELRMVLRESDKVWGALVLFRDHAGRPFGDTEVARLSSIADALSHVIRKHPVRRGERVAPLEPGTVLLSRSNGVEAVSAGAQTWLDDLVPGGEDQTLPKDVTRVLFDAANALRTGSPKPGTCVRTVSGRWLEVTASELAYGDADVAVSLHGATADQVLATQVLHHGLTRREAEVLEAAVGGLASKQIARRLGISVWTVSEHLAAVYRKYGVTGRDELLSTLV